MIGEPIVRPPAARPVAADDRDLLLEGGEGGEALTNQPARGDASGGDLVKRWRGATVGARTAGS
jgi:hypothetical protein